MADLGWSFRMTATPTAPSTSNGPNITYVPVSAAGGTLVADRRRRLQLWIGTRRLAERGDRHALERTAGRRVRARLDGGCGSRRLPQCGERGRNRDAIQHRQSAGCPSQCELAGESVGRRHRQPGSRRLRGWDRHHDLQRKHPGTHSSTAPRTRSARPSPSRITRRDCAQRTWRRSTTIDTRSSMAIRTTSG